MILALPAHAKINLSLSVLGVRPDGHHAVATLIQAISLHDLLLAAPAEATSLAGGFDDDLVLRAASRLEVAAGRPLPTAFRLLKRVPAGAGLGGGSSDAATALRALARLHHVEGVDLAAVAAGVGADVPFFLNGGAALATGRGESLRPAAPERTWYALAWPGFEVDTAAVYRRWDAVGGDGGNHLARAALEVEPRLRGFAQALGEGWRMTGSGSAFFRAAASRPEAERAIAGLRGWTAVASGVAAWGW